MLYNIDIGNMEWYESLSDEEKKSFSPYVSMRFASSVKGIKSLQLEYIENVNEFCNKDFSLLQKHDGDSKLFWKLLALCGVGKKMFHPWIKAPKGKGKKTKLMEFLDDIYPTLKNDEKELLKKLLTKQDIKQLAKDAGLNDNEIKSLV
jgi:hypothetical protein